MSSTSLSPVLPRVLIVSPALADANNGNWHTASRWSRMLRKHCRIGIARDWSGEPFDLLIALHARRSAASIDAWAKAHPDRPLVVVLTGTDLYRDIHQDPVARSSLRQATHLVALQDEGPRSLDA
ncbi:MAG: TIGR04348 family glycosyltransferase, partial [Caldimonas sp.]